MRNSKTTTEQVPVPDEIPWIWLDSQKHPDCGRAMVSAFADANGIRPVMAVFSKCFFADNASGWHCLISGDSHFRVFINGEFLTDGPVEVGGDYANTEPPEWWFGESLDLSGHVRAGWNEITAQVMNVPEAQTDYSIGSPGFCMELLNSGKRILTTDSTWSAFADAAWKPGRFSVRERHGAAMSGRAVVSTMARRKCRLLNLPKLQRVIVRPCSAPQSVDIRPHETRTIEYAFECELAGFFLFDFESGGESVIKVQYYEAGELPHSTEEIILRGGISSRGTRMQAFKKVRMTVSADAFGARISNVRAEKRSFPVRLAPFEASETWLCRMRDCIDRTMQMCMQREHLDSPVHQEGLGCTGDYWIESLIEFVMYGEWRLAHADIFRTSNLIRQKKGVMFHTSYSMLFIEMLYDCYMYTGDASILSENWDSVCTVLGRFSKYLGSCGLITEAPNFMFIDWVKDGNISYHHPPAGRGMGPMTAFYIRGLQIAILIGNAIGKDISAFSETCTQLKSKFNELLWDSARGLYADGIPWITKRPPGEFLPPEDGVKSFSKHTNILAVAYGIAPEERSGKLLEKVFSDDSLIDIQPYFAHFAFMAIHECGAFEKFGWNLLERWKNMVENYPYGLRECWEAGDYSHAWSGTPAIQMSREILGVTITTPGCSRIRIAPVVGNLTYARGDFPTKYGIVHISWTNDDRGFRMTVEHPPQVIPECVPPLEPAEIICRITKNNL